MDEITIVDAFEAYKKRAHDLFDELALRDGIIRNLKQRIEELERDREPDEYEHDEGGVDPTL